MKRFLVMPVFAAAVVILAACSGQSRPAAAGDACISGDAAGSSEAFSPYINTGEESVTISTPPSGDEGEETAVDAVLCVLDELDASPAVRTRIANTTSLMGVVEATENGLLYEVTYHPDNGMLLTVTEQDS